MRRRNICSSSPNRSASSAMWILPLYITSYIATMNVITAKVSRVTRPLATRSHCRGGLDPRPFPGGHQALPYGWDGVQGSDVHPHERASGACGILAKAGIQHKISSPPLSIGFSPATSGLANDMPTILDSPSPRKPAAWVSGVSFALTGRDRLGMRCV